ncbi:MAG: adenylyl-sulfate kinase [Bacteroidetes bacterium]|nr:adenylyl-sulfate kinase [Bacteroidota bacterium]
MSQEVYPLFEKLVSRQDKERALNQRARVIWFTGLPCSGKTTLALCIEKELFNRGYFCQVLDGDNVRCGINSNLGFSNTDRLENIRRIAEVSKLFLNAGVITINAFVSPTQEIRSLARTIIGEEDFIEVFLNPSIEVCEQRDVKGMYRKARAGQILDFTGVNAPFEKPEHPSLVVKTDSESIEISVSRILEHIIPILEIREA